MSKPDGIIETTLKSLHSDPQLLNDYDQVISAYAEHILQSLVFGFPANVKHACQAIFMLGYRAAEPKNPDAPKKE